MENRLSRLRNHCCVMSNYHNLSNTHTLTLSRHSHIHTNKKRKTYIALPGYRRTITDTLPEIQNRIHLQM